MIGSEESKGFFFNFELCKNWIAANNLIFQKDNQVFKENILNRVVLISHSLEGKQTIFLSSVMENLYFKLM